MLLLEELEIWKFSNVVFIECSVICRYQKLWKHYIRLKHLVANKPKVLLKDREKLRSLEEKLQKIRLKGHVFAFVNVHVKFMKLIYYAQCTQLRNTHHRLLHLTDVKIELKQKRQFIHLHIHCVSKKTTMTFYAITSMYINRF